LVKVHKKFVKVHKKFVKVAEKLFKIDEKLVKISGERSQLQERDHLRLRPTATAPSFSTNDISPGLPDLQTKIPFWVNFGWS
jgi:hypothetical protein